MPAPTLVIFTGLPGTGKTSLSQKIAQRLPLPLVAKDTIKEIMFDELGWSNKEWSAKLALATFRIMDYVIEQQLRGGNSLIAESNFIPSLANTKFQRWGEVYGCRFVQVVCLTDAPELVRRVHERSLSDRHPGHLDRGTVAGHEAALRQRLLNGEDQPLDLPGEVIKVNTTDFSKVNVHSLAAQISCCLI